MSERTVEKVLELDVTVEKVWSAITDPTELARWFGDEAEVDLRPGGDAAMTWEDHGATRCGSRRSILRATRVELGARVRGCLRGCPRDPRRVDADPAGRWRHTLRLCETGFRTDLHHRQNTEGWDAELAELVELLSS